MSRPFYPVPSYSPVRREQSSSSFIGLTTIQVRTVVSWVEVEGVEGEEVIGRSVLVNNIGGELVNNMSVVS